MRSKITKGASGALRQEFCELELLDEITALRFNSELRSDISGFTRNDILLGYRKYRGMSYIPTKLHTALKWNCHNPWLDPEVQVHVDILDYSADVVSTKASTTPQSCKRVRTADKTETLHDAKRQKSTSVSSHDISLQPPGLIWSRTTAVRTILCLQSYITFGWLIPPLGMWSFAPSMKNGWVLSVGLFSQCNNGTMTLENMRDDFAKKIHDHNPQNM